MRKKKEGVLRKDVDTRVESLFARYDSQRNGALSMAEFTQLQRDVIDLSPQDPARQLRDVLAVIDEQRQEIQTLRTAMEGLQATHKSISSILSTVELQ